MSEEKQTRRSDADAELEREIRKDRKFTLAEAIGRMAGPGAMKGTSPITGVQQAGSEIETWLRRNLADAGGALETVLLRGVKESELLLNNFEQPLVVLGAYCNQVLGSDFQLKELVRQADIEWGRVLGERPYFEQEGTPTDPDDPYTVDSVRKTLSCLQKQLGMAEETELRNSSVSDEKSIDQ